MGVIEILRPLFFIIRDKIMQLYRLQDKATGLFSIGTSWTKNGKVYLEKGHVKSKLSYQADWYYRRANEKAHEVNLIAMGYDPHGRMNAYYFAREHNYNLFSAAIPKPQTKEELYSYLPDTWVIVVVDDNGMRDLCKAKDFWKM